MWHIFNEEGANEYATWVWDVFVPGTRRSNYAAMANYYYPGDEFVDWIGIDGYQLVGVLGWGFDELFSNGYSIMRKKHPSKPIIVVETGCDESPSKAKWVKNTFKSLKERYRGIKGICWWDMNWSHGRASCDSRIDSSPKALEAFKQSIADPYFLGKVPYRKI